MDTQVGVQEFVAMMLGVVEQVKNAQRYLSELDAACGDGDHGTTMLRAMNRLETVLADDQRRDLKTLVYSLGWTLLSVDGGATGPLLGSLFLGMSEALGEKQELDAAGLAAMFEAGLKSVERQTKAKIGDKTMIDALAPAVAVLRDGAEKGKGIPEILRDAADAAQRGAASTRGFVARFGKAKYSAERSLGHQDAGATSIAMIFQGFHDGYVKLQRP